MMKNGDFELGPFATLYEEWVGAYPDPRDPRIEERLAGMYRDAWASGDPWEQLYVLSFVFDHKDQNGADLMVEGLKSNDRRVARRAAALASATHDWLFDLGPDLRPAFHALARRFPENSGFRTPDLYGHLEGDEDDRSERAFVNLFEDWRADECPRNDTILRQLIATYRQAWETGDGVDRAVVINFLLTNGRPANPSLAVDGRDLIIEALLTDDPVLAPMAAFAAWCMIEDGIDLGPRTREALQAHDERFPERGSNVRWALKRLDEREQRS